MNWQKYLSLAVSFLLVCLSFSVHQKDNADHPSSEAFEVETGRASTSRESTRRNSLVITEERSVPLYIPIKEDAKKLVYLKTAPTKKGYLQIENGRRGPLGSFTDINTGDLIPPRPLTDFVLVHPRIDSSPPSKGRDVRTPNSLGRYVPTLEYQLTPADTTVEQEAATIEEATATEEANTTDGATVTEEMTASATVTVTQNDDDDAAVVQDATVTEEVTASATVTVTQNSNNYDNNDNDDDDDDDDDDDMVAQETTAIEKTIASAAVSITQNDDGDDDNEYEQLISMSRNTAMRDGISSHETAAMDVDIVNNDNVFDVPNISRSETGFSFVNEINVRLANGILDIGFLPTLYDFGGNGNCGPSSLAGALNYFGGSGLRQDTLRQIVGNHVRQRVRNDLNFLAEIQPYTIRMEVRGPSGLEVVNDLDSYLTLMETPGYHWDELAFRLAADALNTTIYLHYFRPGSNQHVSRSYGNGNVVIHLALLADGPNSNDGHYMALLPREYWNDGYQSFRETLRDRDEDFQLNDLLHRVFGYHEIDLSKVSMHRANEFCPREEGELFGRVVAHAVKAHVAYHPGLQETYELWRFKFEEQGLADLDEYPSARTTADFTDIVRPLFQQPDNGTDIHTWDAYVTAFSKEAGKGSKIIWWDGHYGQIKWAFTTSGVKRIAFERLYRQRNIFPRYVELDGIIARVGNQAKPITTNMAYKGPNGTYAFIMAIYLTKCAKPDIHIVVGWYIHTDSEEWILSSIDWWGDDSLSRLSQLEPMPSLRPPSTSTIDDAYNNWLDSNDDITPSGRQWDKNPKRFSLETAPRDPQTGSATIDTLSGSKLYGSKCFDTSKDYSSFLHSVRPLARPPSAEALASQPIIRDSPTQMIDKLKSRHSEAAEVRKRQEEERRQQEELERQAKAQAQKERQEKLEAKRAEKARIDAEAKAQKTDSRRAKSRRRSLQLKETRVLYEGGEPSSDNDHETANGPKQTNRRKQNPLINTYEAPDETFSGIRPNTQVPSARHNELKDKVGKSRTGSRHHLQTSDNVVRSSSHETPSYSCSGNEIDDTAYNDDGNYNGSYSDHLGYSPQRSPGQNKRKRQNDPHYRVSSTRNTGSNSQHSNCGYESNDRTDNEDGNYDGNRLEPVLRVREFRHNGAIYGAHTRNTGSNISHQHDYLPQHHDDGLNRNGACHQHGHHHHHHHHHGYDRNESYGAHQSCIQQRPHHPDHGRNGARQSSSYQRGYYHDRRYDCNESYGTQQSYTQQRGYRPRHHDDGSNRNGARQSYTYHHQRVPPDHEDYDEFSDGYENGDYDGAQQYHPNYDRRRHIRRRMAIQRERERAEALERERADFYFTMARFYPK